MGRTIIHLDLDAFFCAVTIQQRPALQGVAFAVGGRPDERGVVASCSYPARQYGIHSAMPMAQAVRLCPTLLIVPPDFPAYRAASRAVMERLRARTPLVEQLSIDEAFLDVSAVGQPGRVVATALQDEISRELGLSCSLGVASNKLCAKIATDVAKTGARRGEMPRAICVVEPGHEAAFLAPLPVTALWGVGPKTAERLASLGMHTIGDIAAWPEDALLRHFGKHGWSLARHARGIDERGIETTRVAKSISQEATFPRDRQDRAGLLQVIAAQAQEVSDALRRKGVSGTTVTIKVRWSDFTTVTRQTTLSHATDGAQEIAATAARLFDTLWQPPRPVRLIGVGMSGLQTVPRQPTLWDSEQFQSAAAKQQQLQAAMDTLRKRFGDKVVQRGSALVDPE